MSRHSAPVQCLNNKGRTSTFRRFVKGSTQSSIHQVHSRGGRGLFICLTSRAKRSDISCAGSVADNIICGMRARCVLIKLLLNVQ